MRTIAKRIEALEQKTSSRSGYLLFVDANGYTIRVPTGKPGMQIIRIGNLDLERDI